MDIRRGIFLPIEEVTNSGNKLARLQALRSYIKNKMIQFNKNDLLLIEQLCKLAVNTHDDGPDALEMCFRAAQETGKVEAYCGMPRRGRERLGFYD